MKFIVMNDFCYLFDDGIHRTVRLAYDVEFDIVKKAQIKTVEGWRWPTQRELQELTKYIKFEMTEDLPKW